MITLATGIVIGATVTIVVGAAVFFVWAFKWWENT